ncbi:5-methyltetrahydrofolate--homocysteine methyltransferase [hydrothermal vent metagenome]|uniref:5-methyltetrahydrofolate--homocysteine methyltransferase n=1 Tax=hydrothermal vent metagenome TaxID=652676 RepID=A0A3B0QT31_9ZZZZ
MNNEIHNRKYLKKFRKELRNNPTKAETKLWPALRKSQLDGKKFRRQQSIENFIVDFCCPSEKLIIEVDGEVHNNFVNNEYDFKRTERLNKLGYKVIRFTNENIFKNLDLVIEAIKQEFK